MRRRPSWVAPHQPRLDWQMWFAALEGHEQSAWYRSFCVRLLEGSPDVLALLAKNPFPSHPPRYVRGSLYQYRMTDAATRRATGAWWTREPLGEYLAAAIARRDQGAGGATKLIVTVISTSTGAPFRRVGTYFH